MSVVWKVRLAAQAELDFSEIITWTLKNFGERQAQTYAETLTLAIEALHDGPEQLGARARDDIEPGIRILHVARQGRSGRHFVLFSEADSKVNTSMSYVCFTTAWTWLGISQLPTTGHAEVQSGNLC
jgi:toxin ParE1/3/4